MRPFAKFAVILACLIVVLCRPVGAQMVMEEDEMQHTLGSVQVGSHTVGFVIAYAGDAAILDLFVRDAHGLTRYAPLFASTYRGVPSVDLDIYVSASKEELWVRSSWSGSEVLAYHRLGTDTAMTGFGENVLIDTPMVDELSGGPRPYPTIDGERIATFYHRE